MKTFLKQIALILPFLLLNISIPAQVPNQDIPPWNTGTIKTQIDYLITKSTLSSEYRVVKQSWLYTLKARILDTIKIAKQELTDNRRLLENKTKQADSLKLVVNNINSTLSETSREKESISLFGIQMVKSKYKTVVWTIIAILAIALFLFIALFKRSNYVAIQLKTSQEELKEEFEAFRKRSLIREEEMARKHLYELNKYKK